MTTDTIIAVAALALSFYGMYATRHHNKLSVTPHIVANDHLDRSDGGLVASFDIHNHGIGPARIKRVLFFLDGKPFAEGKGHGLVEKLIEARVAGRTKYVVRSSGCPGIDYALAVGERYRIVEVEVLKDWQSEQRNLAEIFKGLAMRIEYESVYGERFIFDTDIGQNRRSAS